MGGRIGTCVVSLGLFAGDSSTVTTHTSRESSTEVIQQECKITESQSGRTLKLVDSRRICNRSSGLNIKIDLNFYFLLREHVKTRKTKEEVPCDSQKESEGLISSKLKEISNLSELREFFFFHSLIFTARSNHLSKHLSPVVSRGSTIFTTVKWGHRKVKS